MRWRIPALLLGVYLALVWLAGAIGKYFDGREGQAKVFKTKVCYPALLLFEGTILLPTLLVKNAIDGWGNLQDHRLNTRQDEILDDFYRVFRFYPTSHSKEHFEKEVAEKLSELNAKVDEAVDEIRLALCQNRGTHWLKRKRDWAVGDLSQARNLASKISFPDVQSKAKE